MATKPKRPRDVNQLAKLIVAISTGEAPPDTALSKKQIAGRTGGMAGGEARAKSLSSEQRSQIAKKAASKRWKKATEPVG